MADEAPKKKRKREETFEARITYHTPLKTFERLFQGTIESSLEETRRVVRRKLGLADNAKVQLSQIRGNNTIVLEDDDDFQAFCVTIKANPQVDVQVTLSEAATTAAKSHEGEDAPASKRRKVKQKAPKMREESADRSSEQPSTSTATGPPDTDVSISMSSHNANTSGLVSSPDGSKQTSAPFHLFPALNPAIVPHTVAPIKPLSPTDAAKSTKEIAKRPQNPKGETTTKPEKEKKERPKKTRKSETPSAATLSPASREKAAAILKQHRDALEEKAKQPRKRTKKETAVREGAAADKEKVQEAGANGHTSVTEKPEKKKKKTPSTEEKSDETDEPAQVTAVKEHNSSPAKATKKGDKEGSKAQGSSKAKSAKVTERESSEGEEAETHKALGHVSNDKPLVFPVIKKPAGKSNTKSAVNGSIPLEKEMNPELAGKKKLSLVQCPICEQPYHQRHECPMVQKGGKAPEDRLKILKQQGKKQFVKDIEKFLDTEKRREMLNDLQHRDPSPRHGSEAFQDADGGDYLMQSDREDGSDSDSVRSMPESVTLPVHGTRSSVGVQRPGEGPGSVSSDDEDVLADAAQSKDISDSSSGQNTPIRRAQPHPPASPSLFGSSISSIKAIGDLQDTGGQARILVGDSSSEDSENMEEGDKMDEDNEGLAWRITPTRNPPKATRHTSGTKAGNGSSMKSQEDAEESGPESDPAPRASTLEKIGSSPQSQTTRGSLFPRLSQLTNFLRRGPTASPVFKTTTSPMLTPTSVPKPIHLPKNNHTKMAEDSSSETESSSDESDRASRLPKNQRASSRLAMHPRRSVLSQLP